MQVTLSPSGKIEIKFDSLEEMQIINIELNAEIEKAKMGLVEPPFVLGIES